MKRLFYFVLSIVLLVALLPTAVAAQNGNTITVNTTAQSPGAAGDCTLGEAIQAANTDAAVDGCPAGSGADTIVLPAGQYDLTAMAEGSGTGWQAGLPYIDSDVTIRGTLGSDGQPASIISRNSAAPAFSLLVLQSGTATLQDLELTGGLAYNGGALAVLEGASANVVDSAFTQNGTQPGGYGGAIWSYGSLSISHSTFTNNTAADNGAAIFAGSGSLSIADSSFRDNSAVWGGAISLKAAGPNTISGSLFAGNTSSAAPTGGGGALYINNEGGNTTVTNSTITGNTAAGDGGGIYLDKGNLTLQNVTLAGNGAPGGPQLYAYLGHATLQNTIVASPTSGANCGGGIVDGGGNLRTVEACGTSDHPLPIGNPKLQALAGNGGPTQTMALGDNSQALGIGVAANCPARDQRGVDRPQPASTNCDAGAYESDLPAPAPIVISPDTLPDGTANTAYSQQFAAGGGTEPYTFNLAGSPPNGLSMSEAGLLAGTPSQTGDFAITVVASDANGLFGSRDYTLQIASAPVTKVDGTFNFTSALNPSAPGQEVVFTLSATGSVEVPGLGVVPPMGMVAFSADGAALPGCEQVYLNVLVDANGSPTGFGDYPAVCQTSALAAGQHQITAVYTDMMGLYNDATASLTQVVGVSDTTPPSITPNVAGTLGDDNWYTSDVNLTWMVTDAESQIASQEGCDAVTITSDQAETRYTCSATSAGGTTSVDVAIKRDATTPAITAAATTAPNANGWYNGDVTVHFTCTDGGSGILAGACPADQVLSGEGPAVASAAQTVTDAAGNTSAASNVVTVKIDKTAPQVDIVTPVNLAIYPPGLTVLAGYTCSDTGSGVASCSGGVAAGAALDTATAGDKSLTVQATDQAGNTASVTAGYRVAQGTPGPVVAWGDNSYGQLNIPSSLTGVTAISAGCYQSLALKSDGTVAGWGGQYGDANVPAGLSGVVAISAGCGHSLALKSDGTVVLWGTAGQIAIPAGLGGVTAIAAGYHHDLAVMSDGTVVAWGPDAAGETHVPAGLSGVIAVAAGEFHSLALKSDGTVVAWGCVNVPQNYGQCTLPAGLSGVTAIAAGELHSMALKSDGTVVAWGMGHDGQTNVPAGLNGVTAIAAGLAHSMALKSDGTVVAWGRNDYGQATAPAGLSGVTAIAGGASHSLAIGNLLPQDTASPVTTIGLSPASPDGQNGWYNSAVGVTVSAADETGGSGLVETRCVLDPAVAPNSFDDIPATPACAYLGSGAGVTGDGQHALYAASLDSAGNKEAVKSAPVKIDKTAPAVSCGAADGQWRASDASIACTATDGGSGLANAGDASFNLSTSVGPNTETVNAQTSSRQVCDAAGNCATAGPIAGNKVDKKAPAISITKPANSATYLLDQVVKASYACTDGGSGVTTCAGPVATGAKIDTATVGSKTFTVNAADRVGNTASASASYQVSYDYSGFLLPVVNPPKVNRVKAGVYVPVRFRLGGYQGLDIFAPGYPQSQPVDCKMLDTKADVNVNETVTVGWSFLIYNPLLKNYDYLWKTDRSWAGSCRQFIIQFDDGSAPKVAYFRFVK